MKGTILTILVMLILLSLIISVTILVEDLSRQKLGSIKKFHSYSELQNFLKENMKISIYDYYTLDGIIGIEKVDKAIIPEAPDYSTTNIQVSGVDEADIVKNDGKYIYTVSGNKIVILDAYPAEDAKILSEIPFKGSPQEIFINRDKLIVFGDEYDYFPLVGVSMPEILPRHYSSRTFVNVYDVSDRSNPVLERNVSVEGDYFDSRMIGDYIYVIINQPVYYTEPYPIPLPRIYSDGEVKTIPASDIYYFDFPDYSYTFTNVLAINTQSDEEVTSKTFLLGYTQQMYVSSENIYVVYTRSYQIYDFYDRIIDEVIIPAVPSNVQDQIIAIKNSNTDKYEKMQNIGEVLDSYLSSLNPEEAANVMKDIEERMDVLQQKIAKEMEKTIIHKISINNGQIDYVTKGEVPGYVLNQFSMDEHDGYFRIATTTGNWRAELSNHVYILDSNLQIVGKLEDLAEGERIYSVRFIGDKGYMVTFRQIDPLFVIDLSNPQNPQVLGFLKIPGVSDYLHPYDDTHVIGIGRDATEEGRIKGMKLSLFDVSDVANPKEVSKYIIGESGTDSEALHDHKALLFSKQKNLLVIPVRVSEGGRWNAWQGAYVFSLDLNNGFVLKGKVTHTKPEVYKEEYYYDYNSEIRRSLYIDDVLYTISNKLVKANSLEDMSEINEVKLPFEEENYPYPLKEL